MGKLTYFETPDYGKFRLIRPLIGFKNEMENRIKQYPFAKNVFLMIKFRRSKSKREKEGKHPVAALLHRPQSSQGSPIRAGVRVKANDEGSHKEQAGENKAPLQR